MKREELEALGLTKEQIDQVLNKHHEELSPVQKSLETAQADLKTAKDKLAEHQATIDGLNKSLEAFKDVDVSDLQSQITALNDTIKAKDAEHAKNLADRDFQDILRDAITSAKGKNAKAITALLDVDDLKKSKNQKEDVAKAIKALTEAEDSKMLFGDPDPVPAGKTNPIGSVQKGGSKAEETLKSALAEHYNKH